MTRERDIERLLDTWFRDGPTDAPDRVVDAVADRISRQSQRPAWRFDWRHPRMTTTFKLATAVAAIAIVAIVGWRVFPGSSSGVGGDPVPTNSASPSASAGPGPTPTPTPVPLLGATESLAPGTFVYTQNGGRTTFSVPAGWRVPTLGNLDFSLAPPGAAADDTVRVFYDMYVASKDVACSEEPEPGIGTAAADIVGDIASNPAVAASPVEPIAIGGLDGLAVNLELAADHAATCPFSDGVPTVALIVDDVPGAGPFWGLATAERLRLVVLDRPAGGNVVLAIDSVNGRTFDELVAEAMPVLESMTFD